jgi:cation:H+ antiporter
MIDLIVLIASLAVLVLASGSAVKNVLKLSKIFVISEMSAGFIILSVSTSLPELIVSISAAMIGQGSLAVGNVLGSNIANITIVLGLAVVISRKRNIFFTRRVFDN